MHSFEISGLNELKEDIEDLVSEYPDETDAQMKKWGAQWIKECNGRMPGSYKSGKKPVTKAWKRKYDQKLHVSAEVEIQNSSPKFHLIENGHAKWIGGKNTGGFVAGKHYAEKTRMEWIEKFPAVVAEFADKMLRGKKL